MNIIEKYIDVNASNFKEMINFVARNLNDLGYVKKSFNKNIIAREKHFPTGLKLPQINIAIPHTDAKHINKSGIVFVSTQKKLKMIEMGTLDRQISVKYFFILLVNQSKMQVDVLTNLIEKLKTSDFISLLRNNASQIDKYFKK